MSSISDNTTTEYDGELEDESWRQLRERVMVEYDHECHFCGVSEEAHREETGSGLDAHHVIPKKDGGSDSLDNLVALCKQCHRRLESLHGKAMSQLVCEENERCAEEVTEAVSEINISQVDEMNDAMQKYVEENPTFRDNWDDTDPYWGLPGYILDRLYPSPNQEHISERAFFLYQGYLQGVQSARYEITEELYSQRLITEVVDGFPEKDRDKQQSD